MYSSVSEDDRPTSGERYSWKPRCQAVEPGRVGRYEVEDGQERLAQGPVYGRRWSWTAARGDVALVTWAERLGPVARVGIEGTGTFGAGLTRLVRADGLPVVEVARPDRSLRRRQGKSDPIDAQAAARATLAGVATVTPKTREARSR